ncbi:MAG: ABC transporter ATP-binding protein [Gammaproteobacteria bacterium]|nr:MAG: ABC transporter ATP-binding protein [Gammaproteobacteria bacterium]
MIRVQNLSRHYGEFKAVDGVSFDIARGEVVGLLGHNGAGKTTIMKMMTGFLEPTQGTILLEGKDVWEDLPAMQRRLGYLPENCPVWPEMTVMEYLEFQASLHEIAPEKRHAALIRALQLTALKEKALQPIQTLSRGYRQRVGVAQAILHQPDIIILDEPTNGLDPTQIHQMRSLIRNLAKEATVILSTHILQEVQAVCDRVLIMRSGKLVVDSRLEDLQTLDRVRVVTNNPGAVNYLKPVTGGKQVTVQQGNDGRVILELEAAAELLPEIAASIHKAGDTLYALHPLERNLETVFAEVNAQ